MTPIEKLKKQHEQILALADQMEVNAKNSSEEYAASAAIQHLQQLKEALDEHLTIEDDFLYPAFRNRSDPDVRDTANLFAVQFGGIRLAFDKHLAKWTSPGKIRQAPKEFLSETKGIAGVLKLRIKSEENDLFPLLG